MERESRAFGLKRRPFCVLVSVCRGRCRFVSYRKEVVILVPDPLYADALAFSSRTFNLGTLLAAAASAFFLEAAASLARFSFCFWNSSWMVFVRMI